MSYRIAGGRRGPEFSRHIKVGGGLVIAGFLFSSCRPFEARANSDPTITPTRPTATEFSPTPVPNFPIRIEGISPNKEEIQRLGGRFIGVGGSEDLINIKTVYMREFDALHLEFLRNSLSPVTGADLETSGYVLTTYGVYEDGSRVCYPALPERLYSPERPTEIGFPWLFANNLVSHYGDQQPDIVRFKGIGAITLKGLPEDIVCVTAFVNKDNAVRNPETGEYLSAGTTLNVPVNIITREIYDGIPAFYSAEDNVEINQDNFTVLVNGTPVWYMGDRMAQLLATPTPTVTRTPTPTRTPFPTYNPSETPAPYEIREGYEVEIRETVEGVPVSIDIITDTSLQRRSEKPVQRVYVNENFSGSPAHDVAEATMRALYYAWVDDDRDARRNISFEAYMRMVRNYSNGQLPLERVAFNVWANDLRTKKYDIQPFGFDPTMPIRVIFVDRKTLDEGQSSANMIWVGVPGEAYGFGTQRGEDGTLEIWIHYAPRLTENRRTSWGTTLMYTLALNRLSWPEDMQDFFYSLSKTSLPYNYHSDVFETMARWENDEVIGGLTVSPNDTGR